MQEADSVNLCDEDVEDLEAFTVVDEVDDDEDDDAVYDDGDGNEETKFKIESELLPNQEDFVRISCHIVPTAGCRYSNDFYLFSTLSYSNTCFITT